MSLTIDVAAPASSASGVLLQRTDLELDRCKSSCAHYSVSRPLALIPQEIDINQITCCQLESLKLLSLPILAGVIDHHATKIWADPIVKWSDLSEHGVEALTWGRDELECRERVLFSLEARQDEVSDP
jgi:hypothetical protein